MSQALISAFALLLTAALLAIPAPRAAAQPARSTRSELPPGAKRESIEWADIWVTNADHAKHPRVLLIGDSITRSYYSDVEKALAGKADCARLATSKSLCDPAYRKELRLLLDDYRFAVIHINNGLHGWGYSEADYAKFLPETLDFIRRHAKGAKLIWATTTPVRSPKDLKKLDPRTDRVRKRNRIAVAAAQARHVPIDDLFSLVIDHPEYTGPDGVHFNSKGVAVLGHAVAQSVLNALKPN